MIIYETIDGDRYSLTDSLRGEPVAALHRLGSVTDSRQFIGYLWPAGQGEYRWESDTSPALPYRVAMRALISWYDLHVCCYCDAPLTDTGRCPYDDCRSNQPDF